ncbi:MAG TPA: hypothetical protein VMU04_02915 [Candidatus Acidoferrum sp.]|nr:hypothetical protein [Candidatus Acidoferrum sp.]
MTVPTYVRYEARAMLASVAAMEPAVELAHRRLWDLILANGACPRAAPDELRTAARVSKRAWPGVHSALLKAGWTRQRGLFAHPAALALLREARLALVRSQRGGKLGAQRRWASDAAGARPSSRAAANLEPNAAADRAAPRPADVAVPEEGHSPCPPYGPPIRTSHTSPAASKSQGEGEKEKSVPKSVNATERLPRRLSTLSPSAHKKQLEGEAGFLKQVLDTMLLYSPEYAQKEVENWGGWWRLRFRERPDKARTVLAEIRGMIRERRIGFVPGAAAVDLWKRLP